MDLFAIADKCKLIGFTTGNDIHKIGIYTVNENNKVFKKIDFDHKKHHYRNSKTYELTFANNVYNSFDNIYINKEHYDLFVIEKNNKFKIALFNKNQEHIHTYDEEFIVAPMLIYNADKKQYYFISQMRNDVINWYEIKEDKLEESKEFKIENKNLYKYHSSAIIDLYANLKPVVAFETVRNGVKFLTIYVVENTEIFFVNEYFLGRHISPIHFLPNKDTMCSFDLWFARKKGNENTSEIVMLKNKIVPLDTIKKANTEYRAGTYVAKNRIHAKPLDQIFSEEFIVCQTANELKTTTFDKERYERFHIADIIANGTFHFFFLTEQDKIEIKQLVEEKELSEDTSNTFNEFLSSDINNHILNMTSADISNNGKQSLLISKRSESDREMKIFAIDFSTQSNNNKIEILAFFKDKIPQYVPGASYLIGLNNGNQRLLFSQSPQSSYPSLQQKGTFVGVGTTHFFLTFLFAGLPLTSFKEHVKNCPASIFPTTITVLTFERNDMLYMCFFTSPHLNLVTIILFIMLLIALGIIIYLTFQERKRQKIKTKNDNIQKFMKMV